MRKQHFLAGLSALLVISVAGAARAGDRWQYGRLATTHRLQQQISIDSMSWTAGQTRFASEDVTNGIAKFFKNLTGKEWVSDEVKDSGLMFSVVMDELGNQGWELIGFQVEANRTLYVFKRRLADK